MYSLVSLHTLHASTAWLLESTSECPEAGQSSGDWPAAQQQHRQQLLPRHPGLGAAGCSVAVAEERHGQLERRWRLLEQLRPQPGHGWSHAARSPTQQLRCPGLHNTGQR